MWHRNIRHCPLCGSDLAAEQIEGRARLRCGSCSFVFFQNPAAASAALLIDARGRVLLVRRGIEPFRGDWALPAGYQEIDETPAEACVREAREETGLEIETVELFDLLFVPENVRKPANLAVYIARVVGGELEPSDDALDAAWFELDHLPENVAFENTVTVLGRLRSSPAYHRACRRAVEREASRDKEERGEPVTEEGVTYRDAGVDIDAQEKALAQARDSIRASFTDGVLGDVGLFGGLFDLERAGAGSGVLVASADGVGTKLEVAKMARSYRTVGGDLVNHCINDILVQGARPLFFMDYVGTGRLEPDIVSELIGGCADACAKTGVALLGGETAEMPGLYAAGDFDLVGFIVGVVERDKILDGSRVRPGQIALGLESSGLHTNGYSLARKIAFERLFLSLDDRPDELDGRTLGEALLAPHRSYLDLLWPLLQGDRIAALAHITGGGLPDNLARVLGDTDAVLDPESWERPGLFRLLCEGGSVPFDDAHRTFNMGIGMVLLVEPEAAATVRASLEERGERVHEIGVLEPGRGTVRWRSA